MKTILISGGSQGLGRALAERFVKKYNVVILARNPGKTEQAGQEIGCDFVVADVGNYEQVENAVTSVIKKFRTIEYVINNAGLWIQGPLDSNDPARIKEVIDTNTTGTIFLTRAVLPYMKEVKKGKIINIISQSGLYGKAERSVYHASKWAITGFTKSLQMELAGSDITVTGFYPGSMKTQLFESAGIEKASSRFMELPDAVRALEFIVETPDDITIPELGIKPTYY